MYLRLSINSLEWNIAREMTLISRPEGGSSLGISDDFGVMSHAFLT